MDLRIVNFRSNRISNESNQGVVVYMFNADCRVGVVYLIMWKPTTLLHATLYVLFFFVCTVGLRIYNLLITYDDDHGRRQLSVNGGQGGANFFQGATPPPSVPTNFAAFSPIATDSFPLYIMTYRKAKQQYSVFLLTKMTMKIKR